MTANLEVASLNLASSEILGLATIPDITRDYDKVIVAAHHNPESKLLFLALANTAQTLVFDLFEGITKWQVPYIASNGTALCMASDSEKLLIAYDSNQIQLFDLQGQCLHPWSRAH